MAGGGMRGRDCQMESMFSKDLGLSKLETVQNESGISWKHIRFYGLGLLRQDSACTR